MWNDSRIWRDAAMSRSDFYRDTVDLDTGQKTRWAQRRNPWRFVRAVGAAYLALVIAAEAFKEWEAWWAKR